MKVYVWKIPHKVFLSARGDLGKSTILSICIEALEKYGYVIEGTDNNHEIEVIKEWGGKVENLSKDTNAL